MRLKKELLSERILIRDMREEDASFVTSWRNDPEIKKWFMTVNDITIEQHLDWFRQEKPNRLDCMVCIRSTGKAIGTVNIRNVTSVDAEAGKMIGDKEFWGKGYASEAFKLWIDYCIKDLKLTRLFIVTNEHNISNIKLNEKLGFKKTEEQFIVNGDTYIKMEYKIN